MDDILSPKMDLHVISKVEHCPIFTIDHCNNELRIDYEVTSQSRALSQACDEAALTTCVSTVLLQASFTALALAQSTWLGRD